MMKRTFPLGTQLHLHHVFYLETPFQDCSCQILVYLIGGKMKMTTTTTTTTQQWRRQLTFLVLSKQAAGPFR